MRYTNLIVYLLLMFFSQSAWAISDADKEAFNVVKDAYQKYRQSQKSKQVLGMELDRDDSFYSAPCVDCPNLNKTTVEINKVLRNMAETQKDADLLFEVESLEALYILSQSNKEFSSCQKLPIDYMASQDAGNVLADADKVYLIFDKEIPMQDIGAFHMRSDETNHYIYRGKGKDKNLVVKITIQENGPARVQYFKIMDQKQVNKDLAENLSDNPLEEKLKKKKGANGNRKLSGAFGNFNDEGLSEGNSYNVNLGLGVESGKHLPRKIFLLEAEGKTEVADGFSVRGRAEISTKKQEAKLKIGSDENYVEVNTNAKGDTSLKIPLKLRVVDTLFDFSYQHDLNTKSRNAQLEYRKERIFGYDSFSIKTRAGVDEQGEHSQSVMAHYSLNF